MAQAPSPLGLLTSSGGHCCRRNPSGCARNPPSLSAWPFSLRPFSALPLALPTGPSHWPFPLAPTGPSHWPFPSRPFPMGSATGLSLLRLFRSICLSPRLVFHSGLSLWPFSLARYREAWVCGGARWAASSYSLCARASGGPKCFQWGQDRFSVRPTNSSARGTEVRHASLQAQARRASPRLHRAGGVDARRGLLPDQVRQHARQLHGEPRRAHAALAQGAGSRLGDGRVRHAAARHHRAHRGARRPSAIPRAARRRSSA